ncbi:hypothetical protein AGMMS49545_04110 [Betaproteobacteria bacterium]|nr:hypothetical protein AGMMS49545_04110 [Betaproteobacteria bacterium]GHU43077.1 hypothetical protein AGMMS50289_08880 [Betaproteobacteria bacterium]
MNNAMRCLSAFLFCLALSIFSIPAHAAGDNFRSPDEFMLWIENYVEHPEPERIPAAFGSIQSAALIRISPDFVPILGGFFAAAFQHHPERVADWVAAMARDLNADSTPVFLQTMFLADSSEMGEVVARQPEQFQNPRFLPLFKSFAELTPIDGENAILIWLGAFLMSGDAAPVEHIIGALHGQTQASRKAFQILANLVPKSPRLRAICENALHTTDDSQLAEVLRQLPYESAHAVTPVP